MDLVGLDVVRDMEMHYYRESGNESDAPPKLLLDKIEKVADGRVLSLIESFLKSGIMNDGEFEESTEGAPQEGNISPLLSNIYLNHFDRRMGDYGYLLLRYADDIVIFCKSLLQEVRVLNFSASVSMDAGEYPRIMRRRSQGRDKKTDKASAACEP